METNVNGSESTYISEKIREIISRTDLSKLCEYEATPRKRKTAFFKEIAGKAPLLGRSKYYKKYEDAEIVYPVVVQASYKLYSPGSINKAAVIIILPAKKEDKKDFKILNEVVDILVAMRDDELDHPNSLT